MIKYNAINLFAKLDFSKLPTLPTTFVDQKIYNQTAFTNVGSTTLDSNKYLNLNGSTQGIRSTTTYNVSTLYNDDIQFECHFILTFIKSSNVLFALDSNNISEFKIDVTKSGISIVYGTKKIFCAYDFNINVDYHLLISKDDFVYTFIVNGDPIGKLDFDSGIEFSNYINIVNKVYYTIGRDMYSTNTSNIIDGKMYNINISNGVTLHKEPKAYSKYRDNLISRINLGNNLTKTTDYYPCMVDYFNYNWVYTYDDNLTSIVTDINSDFRLDFSLISKKPLTNVNLFTCGNYKVNLTVLLGSPDPEVVVNEFTKSALDFEDGIIDKVSTTIWNKEGTADVTTTNVIFNDTSFETKALGDSLYTNSSILTGGATPFTIEFYALINGRYGGNSASITTYPLISKDNDSSNGDQFIFCEASVGGKLGIYRDINGGGKINSYYGKNNIKLNEINKYSITYDGAALRCFINDNFDMVLGVVNGFKSTTSMPFKFMEAYIPSWSQFRNSTKGIIDNINIFDGECRQVRDYDEYADNLVVDLSFDGENNSTKIVDNGTLKSNWNIQGSAKISTDQKFDGFSSLDLTSTFSFIRCNTNINLNKRDFTISLVAKRSATSGAVFQCLLVPAIDTITNDIFEFAFTNDSYPIAEKRNKILFGQEGSFNGLPGYPSYFQSIKSYLGLQEYKLDLIRSKDSLSLYVNGILDSIKNIQDWADINLYKPQIGHASWSTSNTSNFTGYIKNFKIYDGVAVIPEDPAGKIQLDFDNNLNDKYNNSTWTNNGVTFDQVSSVKGYSAKFDDYNDYLETNSNSFNYGSNNFQIDFDLNHNYTGNQGGIVLSNDAGANQNNSFYYFLGGGNSNTGGFGLSQNVSSVGGYDTILLKNVWYSNKAIKYNSTSLHYKNGVLIQAINIPNTYNSNTIRIGKPLSSFGNYDGLIGYIDNFKSYKEIPDDINYYTNSTVTPTFRINNDMLQFSTNEFYKYFVCDLIKSPKISDGIFEITQYIQPNVYIESTGICIRNFTFNNTINDIYGYIFTLDFRPSSNIALLAKGSSNSSFKVIKSVNISDLRSTIVKTKLVANGNNFKCYVNDNLVIDVNDTSYNTSSTLAVRQWNSDYGTSGSNIINTKAVNVIGVKISDLNGNELYYKDWKSKLDVKVDKPAVHLPLETNATNIGFAPLTINSVGNPTYTTIDNKKCIKFESGKYLTIDNNNIFNLGTNSDFYIEFDAYINSNKKNRFNTFISNGYSSYNTNFFALTVANNANNNILYIDHGWYHDSDNSFIYDEWNNIKLLRKNNKVYLTLNDKEFLTAFDGNINLSNSVFCIGKSSQDPNAYLDGYMSNFKMFVGTSEVPTTYNDKKVLDLDFKPTRESYLFKDNNNKCVIHPVNITQRDYQDSRYCCTFNGTNQYIQLGKNDLLNFGYDDFIIEIVFKKDGSSAGWNMLLCDNASTTNFIDIGGTNFLAVKMGGYRYDTPSDSILNNVITKVLIKVYNSVLTVEINDKQVTLDNKYSQTVTNVNFNLNNNTFIGKYYNDSEFFKGTIYSIKVLRNTTDLTLLHDDISKETLLTYDIYDTELKDSITTDLNSNNISIVREDKKHTLIVDGISKDITLDENTNTIEMHNNDNIQNDIKLYNNAFYDTDDFIDPGLSEIGYPELYIDEPEKLNYQFDNLGDYTIKGFIEGYTDRKYQIINTLNDYILTEGIEDYEYYGIDFNYIDEYKIKDLSTNEIYDLYKHEMIKGYISGKVNLSNCGVKTENIDVYCYRNDNHRLIGIYKLDSNSMYVIPNLDVNSFYDIVFKDSKRKIENISSSYRQPVSY